MHAEVTQAAAIMTVLAAREWSAVRCDEEADEQGVTSSGESQISLISPNSPNHDDARGPAAVA